MFLLNNDCIIMSCYQHDVKLYGANRQPKHIKQFCAKTQTAALKRDFWHLKLTHLAFALFAGQKSEQITCGSDMQLVTEWDGAIIIFITATLGKQTATREVLMFECNQYFWIIFWWRKQDCTELKWSSAQTNIFGLISPLEYSGNTEA